MTYRYLDILMDHWHLIFLQKFQSIPSEWAKSVLNDAETAQESIDQVLNEFLKDFKVGSLEDKGWPLFSSAYLVSNAVTNAYTKILALRVPWLCQNRHD